MYRFINTHAELLADTVTPVSIYLRVRDRFANSLLLESSDYHGADNSYSFICCEPVAEFSVHDKLLRVQYPNKEENKRELSSHEEALTELSVFSKSFEYKQNDNQKFASHGLFGYMTYDAVQSFEEIEFDADKVDTEIPQIRYQAFRYVIAINHFKNELHIFEHIPEGENSESKIEEIKSLIKSKNFPAYHFKREGEETTNFTDSEFLEVLKKGKDHCFRGDVFQIVLSRRYQQDFQGDEFNVYRSLRSINPSPYLFYFDYGTYKIFGSSPEAQIIVKDKQATIHPIAGTFKRTGNDKKDAEIAQQLYDDPKENSEHVMLVDLARNDLSRNGNNVKVEVFKEIQYYSHLIHLVSKVNGQLTEGTDPLRVVADTFPAGTLSGSPKYKAMELIDKYENVRRSFYGGAIGFMSFDGDFNHAIMIRSFLSLDNKLHYRAGAGVVAQSSEESELQEVHNKLAALRKALDMAEGL
ncbi:anthranilate synthase component I family protein [Flammeovirga pectinis]|uniref:Anthranilate synthase component 1 n=1 Tax=Flammeovirga pectinis TaxID=2494373 RepID=A0A3Q9FR39_9BACT|nr:anthranilate synthase component I family protein [Flammeovirga pectinis]AZQ64466.1 anthranilate synthase component I family protein [Flammeovirga pectinis]